MQQQPFNKYFTTQFHIEEINLPCRYEQHFEDLHYCQYAGIENEIDLIGGQLSANLSDRKIILDLISKLKKEDSPASNHLSFLIVKLQRTLTAYARQEPCCAHYFNNLLTILKPFFSLVKSYQESTLNILLNDLQTSYESQEIDDKWAEIEEFSDQIRRYYDLFNALLNAEPGDCHRIAVTSPVEEYLMQLITLIVRMMIVTESTQYQLEKWQTKRNDLELQEMYN